MPSICLYSDRSAFLGFLVNKQLNCPKNTAKPLNRASAIAQDRGNSQLVLFVGFYYNGLYGCYKYNYMDLALLNTFCP